MLSSKSVVIGSKGSYIVESLHATGGMSQVYLVRGPDGNRYVAKIPNDLSTSINKLLFERDLLKNLLHEHLIKYIDSGVVAMGPKNLPALVVEYSEGSTLDRIVSKNPMDEKRAKVMLTKLLIAVDYISSRNIVHRDIKPKNILLREDDLKFLKLLDFGTAAFFNTSGVREAVISPGGYTPPEQYNYTFSVQGDIWSSAATCFFALTGRNPDTAMPGYPHRPTNPPDVRKFNRDVSDNFATVLMRAMHWNPLERFSTAKEMIEALDKGIAEVPEEGPILEVFGTKIKIDCSRVIFGRISEEIQQQTTMGSISNISNMPSEKIKVVKGADVMEIYVFDPYRWISRRHFEIFERGGEWFFRDLGSLNRSAILVGDSPVEVWAGYKKESKPFKLGKKAMIYVAYGTPGNPPYVTLTFKS